jgi:hypothetical protein
MEPVIGMQHQVAGTLAVELIFKQGNSTHRLQDQMGTLTGFSMTWPCRPQLVHRLGQAMGCLNRVSAAAAATAELLG